MAINPNSLRLGNLVSFKGNHGLICAIHRDSVLVYLGIPGNSNYPIQAGKWLYKIKDIHPISLTEEWFPKFGFIREAESHFWFPLISVSCTNLYFKDIDGKWKAHLADYVCISEGIIYVHELQNLCYFINGQELIFEGVNLGRAIDKIRPF